MFLEIEGIIINVVRKPVKRVRLTIKPDKSVVLTMPFKTPLKDGEIFAREHIPWIKKHLFKLSNELSKPEKTFEEGETIFVFGTPYTIKINIQKNGITKLYEDFLLLSVAENDAKRRESAVQKFFAEQLLIYAEEKIKYYVLLHGFNCNGLKLRKMTSRWGSCNVKTDIITLNTNLCEKSKELIDYVILHELIHTLVPNHGKNFYAYFDRYMPDHRSRRKKLNGKK